ncbi:DUF1028 domain-containing protein [Erwiniaceae bacterium BAC15a-03b]|uniref:DUF1028 domain-containing protein n=1 Tax=Winslowiella arboricola TaxID=2978220 RepID=A0A9J6PNC2_9GAMM|nr:DUF1028 domain-containing protein [Winslowiella arboricola]MCU5774351.1 DUF1028 domain-containing protein [Winslowiella arboricola]MCU5778898.1 DUF1028 domain-containing protein [Winslowiella arboricola]
MTFSIVARDPLTGALGVASATAGPAVGALVVHGSTSTGAIATQAMTNPLYGIRGLALLRKGISASETLKLLLATDADAARRQVIIIDRYGDIAHWSGKQCGEFAASQQGAECAVAGNLLTAVDTLDEMLRVYLVRDDLAFADRLLAAMQAGAAAGGDRRGLKSAALKIWHDREYASVDLRADWSDAPLEMLGEILRQTRQPQHADFFAALPKGQVE